MNFIFQYVGVRKNFLVWIKKMKNHLISICDYFLTNKIIFYNVTLIDGAPSFFFLKIKVNPFSWSELNCWGGLKIFRFKGKMMYCSRLLNPKNV